MHRITQHLKSILLIDAITLLSKLLPDTSYLFHSLCHCFFRQVTSMELNDANLQTLTEFLRKTLDPDPTVRRPGNAI